MNQLVIGFGAKARQGKDTAANAIAWYYDRSKCTQIKHSLPPAGPTVKIFKFADALYAEVNAFLKSGYGKAFVDGASELVIDEEIDLPNWVKPDPNPEISELAPYGKHPKLLQWWGSEYRRAQDPDYWAKKLLNSVRTSNANIALVSDVRFPNEGFTIEKLLQGYTVNVSRLNADGTKYVDPSRPADHISEVAMDDWNWNFRLVNVHNHQALLSEQAITLVEYLRALKRDK